MKKNMFSSLILMFFLVSYMSPKNKSIAQPIKLHPAFVNENSSQDLINARFALDLDKKTYTTSIGSYWEVELIHTGILSKMMICFPDPTDRILSKKIKKYPKNFRVFVSKYPMKGSLKSLDNDATIYSKKIKNFNNCSSIELPNIKGNYVRIQLVNEEVINIAEVEIIGKTEPLKEKKISFPNLSGNLMKFTSYQHFVKFYSELDEFYEINSGEFPKSMPKNKSFISVMDKLLKDEFKNPSDRYMPFLTDPIMMGIVNESFEFQIEDKLITYMNNEEVLVSPINDKSTRNLIKKMPKGTKVDIKDIPTNSYLGKDEKDETFARSFCGCSVNLERMGCNAIRVFGSCGNALFGDGNGRLRLNSYVENPDWNLNVDSREILNVVVNGNFEQIIPISFDFNGIPIEGGFFKAFIDPNCITGQNKETLTLEVLRGEVSCDHGDKNTGWLWSEFENRAISYRTSSYINFWSSYEHAQIYSKKFVKNKWKTKKGRLFAMITAFRRSGLCEDPQNFNMETQRKDCNNCKKKSVRVNIGLNNNLQKSEVHHCTGDVFGTFNRIDPVVIPEPSLFESVVEYDCCL